MPCPCFEAFASIVIKPRLMLSCGSTCSMLLGLICYWLVCSTHAFQPPCQPVARRRIAAACNNPIVKHVHSKSLAEVAALCGCCRRSSQLATSVVQQFRHALATGNHRLSDTSGVASDPNESVGSDHSFTAGSPAHSTCSAPQLADDFSSAPDGQAHDHIAINMESDRTSR